MKKIYSTQGFGEWAEDYVATSFSRYGWVVEHLRPDYGLDLMIQPTSSNIVRGHFAFVQVKGRKRDISRGGRHRVRLERKHLEFWMGIPLPVYLAVVYREPDEVFVVNVNNYIGNQKKQAGNKWLSGQTHTLSFPAVAKLGTTRLSEIEVEITNHHILLEKVVKSLKSFIDRDFFAGQQLERLESEEMVIRWASVLSEAFSGSTIVSDHILRILRL